MNEEGFGAFIFGVFIATVFWAVVCLLLHLEWKNSALKANAGRYVASPGGMLEWKWGKFDNEPANE